MKHYAIIVSGGSGSRMQTDIPKQFLLLNGRPVLMHTLEAFYLSDVSPKIILVLNEHDHIFWEELCMQHHFTIPHQLVKGGATRFESVKNGLNEINEESIIAIHDGVRPLIDKKIICNSFKTAEEKGSAVTAIFSRDSVRQLTHNGSVALARSSVYLVQTPQSFQSTIIKEAYQQPYSTNFTDDASVVEHTGKPIHLIKGHYRNIKITYPEDIVIAEVLLEK